MFAQAGDELKRCGCGSIAIFIWVGMAGLKCTEAMESALNMALFGDDDAIGNPVAKHCCSFFSHGMGSFANGNED